MLIFLIVVIGLSFLILGHEAGHFLAAKLFKLKVDEFGFGFPPRIFAWAPRLRSGHKGETEYSLNWLPFGGFVKIAGENDPSPSSSDKNEGGGQVQQNTKNISEAERKHLFNFQPAWKKGIVILAGVAVNLLIGWFLISLIFMIGTPSQTVVSDIQRGSPAEKAGLLRGDVIKNFADGRALREFINSHRGEPIAFDIRRGDKNLTVTAVPRKETLPDEGPLGIVFIETGVARRGFFSAIWGGLKQSLIICELTAVTFYDLIKNLVLHGRLLSDVVGPVGIFSVAQEAGKIGLIYLIQLISLISLNLAVINLIPFPALDGGRLFLIIVEKVKGSSISLRTEAALNSIGFVLLILLMVVLTVRDIARLF